MNIADILETTTRMVDFDGWFDLVKVGKYTIHLGKLLSFLNLLKLTIWNFLNIDGWKMIFFLSEANY